MAERHPIDPASTHVMEPLATWIRRQPGRCRGCGYHPPTQGHADGCLKPGVVSTSTPRPKPDRM